MRHSGVIGRSCKPFLATQGVANSSSANRNLEKGLSWKVFEADGGSQRITYARLIQIGGYLVA
jgi:hypothetical protein